MKTVILSRMGCGSSAVPVKQSAPQKISERAPTRKGKALFVGNPRDAKASDVVKQDLRAIVTECYNIPRPDELLPICCISDLSVPLLLAQISFMNGDPTDLIFPVLGISRLEFGRVVALGSWEMLTHCSQDSENDIVFLENFLRWSGGPSPIVRTILLYKLGNELAETLRDLMTGLGFGFEIQNEGAIDFQKYVMIFTNSDLTETDGLLDFIMIGGCIVVGPGENLSSFPINKVICQAGIGFLDGPFFVDKAPENIFEFDASYANLQRHRLPNIIRQFVDIMRNQDVGVETLDKITTLLRYHVMLLQWRGQFPIVYDVCDAALQYLVSTEFNDDGAVCSEYRQAILAILVCEGFKKLDGSQLASFNLSLPYPGKCNHFIDIKDLRVLINQNTGWYWTGLYAPPNSVCTVSIGREIPGLKLQIGCCCESLIGNPNPWKRWPEVSATFDIHQGQTEVGSPFGGLVYFIWENPQNEEYTKFQVELSGMVKAPRWDHKKAKKWESSRDNDVPMTELIGRRIIISLPTSYARTIPSIEHSMTMLDEMIDSLEDSLAVPRITKQYRLVFDIEIPSSGPVCGYPIVLDHQCMPAFFEEDAPNMIMFNFTAMLALWMIPTGLFCQEFEAVLGLIGAWNVFRHKWANVPLIQYTGIENNAIAKEMIAIIKKGGYTSFHDALAGVRMDAKKDTEARDYTESLVMRWIASDVRQMEILLSKIRCAKDENCE